MGAHANTHNGDLGNGVIAGDFARANVFGNLFKQQQCRIIVLPLHGKGKVRHAVHACVLHDHVDFDIAATDRS